jgi:hypothetical protein
MQNKEDIWYRIGFALESARLKAGTPEQEKATTLTKTARVKKPGRKVRKAESRELVPLDDASRKLRDAFLTVGAGTALTRLLSHWPGHRRPGLFRLGKAGAAGAAAAFLTGLLRPLLSQEEVHSLEDILTDLLLSGAGRGLLYAAIVEPRIPGPGLLQGSIYGVLEWALTPWGGLEKLAGPASPQGKIPILSVLLQGGEKDEQLLEHLVFGIVLGLLYED